jgi:hypothetical protein
VGMIIHIIMIHHMKRLTKLRHNFYRSQGEIILSALFLPTFEAAVVPMLSLQTPTYPTDCLDIESNFLKKIYLLNSQL